uniref:DUF7808 domain-containing protein n=1 Tax=Acrobeloides nanus TaxID=290746 RepID=A0A914BXX6_9BILA
MLPCVLIILSVCGASYGIQTSNNQIRRFNCTKNEQSEDAICDIQIVNSTKNIEHAPSGEGCFSELQNGNDTRVFCPTYCKGASWSFVLSKIPSNNNKCIKFMNYQVEQRGEDWFFWRSGNCLKASIQFNIGCSFDKVEEDINIKDILEKTLRKKYLRRFRRH